MLHQIGIGTLGPVFRTYEPSRDRLVAVKAFRLDIVPEQAHALALALSRAARASLFHPSIVEPIDAGVEGTVAFRAEEYVAAESLDVAMRHYAPAPIEKVLPFMTQLAGAIDFARAAGIGHGGLHPRDIFVTPDEARATGFGVVDALEQVGIRAPIRRPYSAPERIDGRAWGTAADVFSLAAIAFELLTGKRPSGTGAEIGSLPDGPHAAAIHAVLARAMDEQPDRRYGTALAFVAALEAASQGRAITDSQEPTIVSARALAPEPAEPLDLFAAQEEAHGPVATDGPLPLPVPEADAVPGEGTTTIVLPPPAGAAPGEFAVEAALDPLHEAIDDLTIPDAHAPEAVRLFEAEDPDVTERFGDDFLAEQAAEPELRSPLEAAPPQEPATRPSLEPPMFRAIAAEPEPHENVEHGRPAILPYALVAVPMLLVGFAGGYFVGSRDRMTPQESTPSVAQYSDQKVSPGPSGTAATETKAPATASAASAPVDETPAAPARPDTRSAPARPTASERRTPVVRRGQIVVHSMPTHAGVTLNGTWRGRTPLTLDELAFGSYVVRVVQPGYKVLRDDVTLSASAPAHTVTARLERTAAAPAPAPPPESAAASFTGSLYVDSRPRGAAVFIDGKSVGQTPVSVPDVRAGSHVVRIEMEGKKPVTANPRITAGKTERITISLEDK